MIFEGLEINMSGREVYVDGKRANMSRYYRLVDFLDYNFTSTFVLFETSLSSNNW